MKIISEEIGRKFQTLQEFSWKLSGMPRYLEAARYWLQYAGMPDTLVYTPTNYRNDYNDDYQSRGYWVNYLTADPYGSLSTKKTGDSDYLSTFRLRFIQMQVLHPVIR